MLNVPSDIKALFNRDNVYKNFHVHFPNGETSDLNNEDIVSESVHFSESLCSQQYFKFGLAEASSIEFECVGVPNIKGAVIQCAIEIDADGKAPAEYFTEKTVSGSTATFTDGAEDMPVSSLSVGINYEQSGSGDPSPTNVRPIYGKTGAVISRSGGGSIAKTFPVSWQSAAGTVYGGTLNVTTGLLTVDRALITIDGTQAVSKNGTPSWGGIEAAIEPTPAKKAAPSAATQNNGILSDKFASNNAYPNGAYQVTGRSTNGKLYFEMPSDVTTAALARTWFANNPTQVVYELATQQTYQLTPVEVTTLLGTNSIWADTGDVSVTYKSTPAVVPQSDTPWLEPQFCNLPDGRVGYRIPYGEFIVDECPRNQGAMKHRKVTAYSDRAIEKLQFFDGETAQKELEINPVDWLNANMLKRSSMSLEERDETLTIGYPEFWTQNGADNIHVYGAFCGNSLLAFECYKTPASGELPIGLYALRVDFKHHEFDDLASEMWQAAIASLPSGSYVYEYFSGSGYKKVFENTAQAMASVTGAFFPCFYLIATYVNGSGYEWNRYSKPIFIKSKSTYLLNLSQLKEFPFWLSTPSGYSTLNKIRVYVCVPIEWSNRAFWSRFSEDVWIENWPLWELIPPDPEEEHKVYRDGGYQIYYKQLTPDTTLEALTIKNTLTYKKTNELKGYHTYENAVSAIDVINGTLELRGQFAAHERDGNIALMSLDNTSPTSIPRDNWAEFWWDENDIEPIDRVRVTFNDGKEDQTKTIKISDTGGSIYEMTDNEVLQKMKLKESKVKDILTANFLPQASVINFTPVDAQLKGLPFLEAGDYITLTADDNETVSSFILEQTIDGIQNLVTTITSTNGELAEELDNES